MVTSTYSVDRDFRQVPNPPSKISVGDNFSVVFNISPEGAKPEPFYDVDPTLNIYYYHVENLVMRAGAEFFTIPLPLEKTFATFQLWDNHIVPGLKGPVDIFSFSILRYLPSGASPVDRGTGLINTQFHYNAYDFTATARHSDSLVDLPSLDLYSYRSGFFGFLNSSSYLQTGFQLSFTTASLTPVPEPASWAMMMLESGLLVWRCVASE